MDKEKLDFEFFELRKEAVMDFVSVNGLSDLIGELKPGVYLSYPDFFYQTIFQQDLCFSCNELTKFSLASFLMYDFLIQLDDLFDDTMLNVSSEFMSALVGMHNLSQRLLSDLFTFNSEFWTFYLDRQKAFIDVLSYESTMCSENNKFVCYSRDFDIGEYIDYFLKKCSFSRLTIDGLYVLSHKQCAEVDYENLIKFNDHFNMAFCILDDVEDFRKDIGKMQLNSAHHYVVFLRGAKTNLILDDFLKDSIEWFYTKGIALDMINMAEIHLLEAKRIADIYRDNNHLNLLVEFKLNDLNRKRKIILEYTSL